MQLGELLSELRGQLLRDKSDQVAGSANDQLWDDDTLVRYIRQAENKFASLTSCIRDSTTADCCQLKLVVGQDKYSLHPSVLAVMSARYPGDNADLARAGHEALNTYFEPDRRYFNTTYIAGANPGKILAFTTDEGMAEDDNGSFNAIEFTSYPKVGAGYDKTLALRVIRLPMQILDKSNLSMRLEIPARYHMDILDWAGYLALRGPDLDVAGGDGKGTADKLRASFMQTVKDCNRDMKRRMFSPLTWGFGRNGFSYERD